MEFAYYFGFKPDDVAALRLRHYLAFVDQIKELRSRGEVGRG